MTQQKYKKTLINLNLYSLKRNAMCEFMLKDLKNMYILIVLEQLIPVRVTCTRHKAQSFVCKPPFMVTEPDRGYVRPHDRDGLGSKVKLSGGRQTNVYNLLYNAHS